MFMYVGVRVYVFGRACLFDVCRRVYWKGVAVFMYVRDCVYAFGRVCLFDVCRRVYCM